VIENPRFKKPGIMQLEGFAGEYDRRQGTPIPAHISTIWTDLNKLLNDSPVCQMQINDDFRRILVLHPKFPV
jgi:hypothetical protein